MSEPRARWLLPRLAWRNVWRRRRRTAITIASIAFGTALCLFFTGLADGMYGRVIRMAVRIGSGHLVLEHPEYRQDPGLEHTIRATPSVIERVAAARGVEDISLRVSAPAMLSSSHGTVGGSFDAVDPDLERGFTPLAELIVDGRYLESDGEVLIGKELARKLDTRPGGKVVLTTQDRSGHTVQELLRVAGVFDTGSTMIDGFYFQITVHRARAILGLDADEVTQLGLYLDRPQSIERAARDVRRSGALEEAHAALVPWREVMKDLSTYIEMDNASNYIFQALLFLVVLAGVLNTVLMSVFERTYEFGVMLSIGMRRGKLVRLIMLESTILAIVGTALGAVLGWIENELLYRYPIDFSNAASEVSVGGFFLGTSLQMNLTPAHFAITLIAVFVAVILVGVYPAWKAGQIDPVEALHTL